MTEPQKAPFFKRKAVRIGLGLAAALAVFAGSLLVSVQGETQFYRGFDLKKKHHSKGHFTNPWVKQAAPNPGSLMWKFATSGVDQSAHPAASVSPGYAAKKRYLRSDSLTWIGHSSFQLRLKEANVLTDPILTDRTSPFSWAGPKRFQKPGLSLEQIGKVDAIIISHNHYDHLDRATIEAIPHKADIDVFVPLGLKRWFVQKGYKKVHELDWWESKKVRGLEFVCLPVQHFSGRGLTDRNRTLWAGWAILGKGLRVFFGGDTGYFPGFKTIGQKYGPFDLALMPIGAYEPRLHFKRIHMNPEEAVRASVEVRAQRVVPIHWGTFPLSLEPPLDPPNRFRKAAKKAGFKAQDTWLMKIGETRDLPRKTTP